MNRSAAGHDAGRVLALAVLAPCTALGLVQLAAGAAPPWQQAVVGITTLSYLVLLVAYLHRTRATHSDRRPEVVVLAMAGVVGPTVIALVGSGPSHSRVPTAGYVMVLVGTGLTIWSLSALGRSISVIPQTRSLVTSGPYRRMRHPVYVGEVVAAAGLAVLAGGTAPWLLLAAFIAVQVQRARWEERLLSATLPGYDAYRARVAARTLVGAQ